MRFRLYAAIFISFIMCGLWCISAHAQLATYVNDQGNLVFTNPVIAPERTPQSKPQSQTVKTGSQTAKVQPISLQVPPDTSAIAIPVKAAAPVELDSMVQETAEKHHVDPNLVRAVISAESNWNSRAVSRKGALGLMQLIPGTAQTLGVGNAFDPAQNVDAGVRYLGMLLERYNGDLSKALAAYNAGPGLVDRFGGVPNIRETRNYVQKVTSTYFGPGLEPQARPQPIYRTVQDDGRVVFTNE